MKKKLFALFAIFILTTLSQSCGKPFKRLIIGVDFSAAYIRENSNEKRSIHFGCTHIIKDKLVFVISYKWEDVSAYIPNFGSVCYAAFNPGYVYVNELLRETFSITFDKPFVYYGETISENTNIFEIDVIKKEIDMYKNIMVFCNRGADLVIDFSDNFFKNSVFYTTDEYNVTFSCKTSDEKFLERTIMIKFEN